MLFSRDATRRASFMRKTYSCGCAPINFSSSVTPGSEQ
jgi:hypothetical protein